MSYPLIFVLQDNYNREKGKCQPKYVKLAVIDKVFFGVMRFFLLTIDFFNI